MDTNEDHIAAGKFKQHCLALIDRVSRTHRPIVISKRGKPMARLVPIETDDEIERRILAKLREGEGGMLVDERTFLQPSSQFAEWSET